MSTETLDRLAAIIDGLAPLGNAGPGEPVVAAEWNAVVGAVQELARIAVARERTTEEVLAQTFARAGHGHDGAVDLTWFDPDTRSMIEGGRAQRADLAAELERARRELTAVRAELDGLRADIQAVKNAIDDVDDRDRDRARSVDRLSARVEGFQDNATSIADLRSTLGRLDGRVGEALAFRDEIVDEAGQRIDLASLRTDVGELLKIRENLTSADGRLVEYRDFERRLVAVEEEVADLASGPPGGEAPGIDVEQLRAEILEAAAAAVDPRLVEIESRLGEVGTSLDGRIAQAEELLGTHAAQIGALQSATAGLPEVVSRVGGAEQRIAGHDARFAVLDALSERMTGAERTLETLPALDARISASESELAAVRDSLAQLDELSGRISAGEARDEKFDGRISATESGVGAARETLADHEERLVALESRADDQDRRIAGAETLGKANREGLVLLSREVEAMRRERGGTSPTQPNPPFPRPGGTVGERPGGGFEPR